MNQARNQQLKLFEQPTAVQLYIDSLLNPSIELEQLSEIVVESPYPDWATAQFRCLNFRVEDKQYAAPLSLLHRIVPINKSLYPREKSGLHLGMIGSPYGHLNLIDLASNSRQQSDTVNNSYELAIVIGDSKWAIACHSVDEVLKLQLQDACWRGRNKTPSWLVAIVRKSLHLLIDPDILMQAAEDLA